MEIKIKETGKIEELNLVDPRSGVDWIGDLMGNHDATPETEIDDDGDETGYYLMSQEDFNWWEDLTERYQKADDRFYRLIKEVNDLQREELLQAQHSECCCDLENYPEQLNSVCDSFYEIYN